MNNPSTCSLMLVLAALFPTVASGQQKLKRSIHVSSPFTLSVENPYGSVRVRGVNHGDVSVRGTLAPGDSLVVERSDRSVKIRVAGSAGDARGPAQQSRLDLEVPQGTPVEAQTTDGDAEVQATGGLVRVKTYGGTATVRGPNRTVNVETVSGQIDVSGPSQAVVATSATGPVRLAMVKGYLEVFTTDGKVVIIDCRATQATVTTVTGSVHFDGTVEPHGLVRLDTYIGDVNLTLPRTLNAALEVSTFGGEITNELGPPAYNASRYAPGRDLQFTLGDGSARMVVSTFAGSVRLTARGTEPVARVP